MRTNEELDRAQRRTAAYAQYVYVDVVFGEAGVDVVVLHKLRPSHPENIIYELVKATQACTVYQDGSSTRRPWGDGYIVLRCDVTNARVRLRLAVESEIPIGGQTTGLSVGSGGSPPPVATPFLVEHNPDGTHSAITLTEGHIQFPATQNPSADINTLDDYEEGTWTPTIGGTGGQSGQVYASQAGQYLKVGRLVFISWRVQLSTLGTITSGAQIQGLPFASTTTTNFRARYAITWTNMTTAFVYVLGAQNENVSAIDLLGATAATTSLSTALVQANLSNTTVIAGSGVYLVNS